jgi:hypothetical protein
MMLASSGDGGGGVEGVICVTWLAPLHPYVLADP